MFCYGNKLSLMYNQKPRCIVGEYVQIFYACKLQCRLLERAAAAMRRSQLLPASLCRQSVMHGVLAVSTARVSRLHIARRDLPLSLCSRACSTLTELHDTCVVLACVVFQSVWRAVRDRRMLACNASACQSHSSLDIHF